MKLPRVVQRALAVAAVAVAAVAQQQPADKISADKISADRVSADRVSAVVEKWLASDQTSEELRDQTVTVILKDAAVGLAWLGKILPTALQAPAEPRSKGVLAVAMATALEFLRQQTTSEVVFAGQYEPLKPLQPYVGDVFFGLLLETPDWYPDTHRKQLVPALRDLQPTLPSAARVERIIALAENAAEPEDLRAQLGCMLWQWGKKQFVQGRLDKLVQDSAEGDAEDRVRALLELAELQYQLRDYKASAATHRSLQSLAAAGHYTQKPTDWYWAACVNALIGNVDRGIEALQKCADLQASPTVDSSHKVKRETFEKDPEIAVLRADARYGPIFARAFGGKAAEAPRGR